MEQPPATPDGPEESAPPRRFRRGPFTRRPPADPGLQQERSTLAWRRTALSMLGVSVLVGKHGLERLGVGATPAFVLVLATIGWALLARLRRQRWSAASSREADFDSVLADGRIPFAASLIVAILALSVIFGAGHNLI